MDCLPPDKIPQTAEVCSNESLSSGLNSVDIYLAQMPTKKGNASNDSVADQSATAANQKVQNDSNVGFDQLPESKQKAIEDEFNKKHRGVVPIGDASMDKSGTINLRMRRTMGGMNADGMFEYKKGSQYYDEVLNHIGGLKPGDIKLVAPFPEKPNKNVTPVKKGGG
ncbi:MAG: hypothetical protein SGJ27_02985 [Candidatus Melainabacteria bacterium]|nr:hypothetical protein [Candidatus Melainabacteria bacterium]